MLIFIFWVALTLLVGIVGRKRNIGFFFAFFWSVLLSPIIGLVITLLSKPKIDKERLKESILNQLDRTSSLYEKNLISESEFEKEKSQLTYRLNNIGKEDKNDKTIHYIGLISVVLIILFIIFIYINKR